MADKNYLIIDIIPLIRVPVKAPDFFSYYSQKEIKEGSIVLVEFKKRKVFGYVWKTTPLYQRRLSLKETKLNLKPVLKVLNEEPIISKNQISLAFWLRNYANLSLASSLSLFFPYLKKFIQLKRSEFQFSEKKVKKILILVPDESYLDFVKKKIKEEKNVESLLISSKISFKKFKELLNKVLNPRENIFISVKTGIFLPWEHLDEVWVYDEGSIFYKEFFKPPFFDYRKIFLKFCEINKVKYIPLGNFPSFYSIVKLKIKPKIEIPFEKIQSFEEFEDIIKNFKKTVIFVPQKSLGKLMCLECFSYLKCETCSENLILTEKLQCPYCLKEYKIPEVCPYCHQKTEFTLKNYGAEGIYKYLLKLKRKVIFYSKEDKKIIDLFNQKDEIDLVGSLLISNPNLENIEAFFFFNFDEFYFTYNLFLREKFIRILDFFSQKTKNIFIFSKIKNPQIENLIKNGEIANYLLKERETNKLPPYKRIIILKSGLQNQELLQKRMFTLKEKILQKNKNLEIFGPLTAYPYKIKKRYFLELVLKVENRLDFNLKKILEDIEVEEIDIESEKI